MTHADYPHEPGRLYDCAACEAECFCKPGETPCVYCASRGHDHDASEAEAERLGAEHGEAAATWVFDGGTGLVTYRGVLAGIENGDPAVLDSLPGPDLSGQGADGYSSTDLERDTESCDDCASDVCSAYESAYREAVEAEVTRVCRYQLGLSQAS